MSKMLITGLQYDGDLGRHRKSSSEVVSRWPPSDGLRSVRSRLAKDDPPFWKSSRSWPWGRGCFWDHFSTELSNRSQMWRSRPGFHFTKNGGGFNSILGDPGATGRDDAMFSGDRHFWRESLFQGLKSPWALFLTKRVPEVSKSVPQISQKNIFLAN